jgi:hypothetical protein
MPLPAAPAPAAPKDLTYTSSLLFFFLSCAFSSPASYLERLHLCLVCVTLLRAIPGLSLERLNELKKKRETKKKYISIANIFIYLIFI